MAVRAKLAEMKSLFEDEDEAKNHDIQARAKKAMMKPESSEWNLHRHKLEYEEAMEKRQHYIEVEEEKQRTAGLKGETPLDIFEERKSGAKKKDKKS